MSNFSDRLRHRRNNLGMTQEDLAARSGFSVSSITAWERGVNPPTMQSLTRLAEALSCNPGWLMMGVTAASPDASIPTASISEPSRGYGPDRPVAPPWIRDLVERLSALEPGIRERAIRQFHLTLDLLMSAGVERRVRYQSSAPDDADDPASGTDPEIAETLRAGVMTAHQLAAARAAEKDGAPTSGKSAPGPKSGPGISRQSEPAKTNPMKTS